MQVQTAIHKYILEPYKGMNSRYHCPHCNSREKTFARYIDSDTGEHIADHVGRCNRESNCGYHYTPKQYFQDNGISFENKQTYRRPTPAKPKPTSYIPYNTFKSSLEGYSNNQFVAFLRGLFGEGITTQLIKKYFIGTSKHWDGAAVFWQIDLQGNVRAGKVMLYNSDTGKRIKEPYKHITWAHTALKIPDYNLKQCLYGEHLLTDKSKTCAIVESEKTAIIASVYLPQFIWLACGSLSNLTPEKCNALRGRDVILFPDLNGFDKWTMKAKELSDMMNVTVSDLLERKATEAQRKQGLDLADVLIRLDHKQQTTTPPNIETLYRELEQASNQLMYGQMQMDDYCRVSNEIHARVQANGILLRDFARYGTVKQQFKDAFLDNPFMTYTEQRNVLQEYLDKGLLSLDAKEVLSELISEDGFVIE